MSERTINQRSQAFEDLVGALQKLMRNVPGDDARCTAGRAAAYRALEIYGRGAKNVQGLKPRYYLDVIRGCNIETERAALADEARKAAKQQKIRDLFEKAIGSRRDHQYIPLDNGGRNYSHESMVMIATDSGACNLCESVRDLNTARLIAEVLDYTETEIVPAVDRAA